MQSEPQLKPQYSTGLSTPTQGPGWNYRADDEHPHTIH